MSSEGQVVRPLSVIIIASEAGATLQRCVTSCQPFASEIVVVDSGSTDSTVDIARRLGCRVIENEWPGYSAQRNVGADAAANDWVFAIDVDETVDDELARALEATTRSSRVDAAYAVRRVNSFMGAWFSEAPESIIRVYDRRRHRYRDALVHEVVDVDGAVLELPGVIWHENHTDLVDATRRLNLYTSLEAEHAAATRPFRAWRLVLRPVLRFGHRYVLQQAFRHGWRGLFMSLHWAYWELMREMKVLERRGPRR